jgi:transcriptional regulator with XRE-family HTH domain
MDNMQERIALIITTKNLTNAEFADAIGVQPSNISHIMSGRNNPSLDLVKKILNRYPEIRLEWLVNGKGAMTKELNLFDFENQKAGEAKSLEKSQDVSKIAQAQPIIPQISQAFEDKKPDKPVEEIKIQEDKGKNLLGSFKEEIEKKIDLHKSHLRKVEKIVIFYEDRTFVEYKPAD